jgi:hypothetical protein
MEDFPEAKKQVPTPAGRNEKAPGKQGTRNTSPAPAWVRLSSGRRLDLLAPTRSKPTRQHFSPASTYTKTR